MWKALCPKTGYPNELHRKDESDWHFLMHMDPSFVDGTPDGEKDFERWLEEDIQ